MAVRVSRIHFWVAVIIKLAKRLRCIFVDKMVELLGATRSIFG
jgi:hypothetical protein